MVGEARQSNGRKELDQLLYRGLPEREEHWPRREPRAIKTRARRCPESFAVDTQGLPHAIHITTAILVPTGAGANRRSLTGSGMASTGPCWWMEATPAAGVRTGPRCGAAVEVRETQRTALQRGARIRGGAVSEKCRRLWKNCEQSSIPACKWW